MNLKWLPVMENDSTGVPLVSVDVGTYQEALEQALADGIVTQEEEARLESFKKDMLSRVHFKSRDKMTWDR